MFLFLFMVIWIFEVRYIFKYLKVLSIRMEFIFNPLHIRQPIKFTILRNKKYITIHDITLLLVFKVKYSIITLCFWGSNLLRKLWFCELFYYNKRRSLLSVTHTYNITMNDHILKLSYYFVSIKYKKIHDMMFELYVYLTIKYRLFKI